MLNTSKRRLSTTCACCIRPLTANAVSRRKVLAGGAAGVATSPRPHSRSIERAKQSGERDYQRQPSAPPWTDPYDLCMSLWAAFQAETAATKAGPPFSRWPEPALGPLSEALVLALK